MSNRKGENIEFLLQSPYCSQQLGGTGLFNRQMKVRGKLKMKEGAKKRERVCFCKCKHVWFCVWPIRPPHWQEAASEEDGCKKTIRWVGHLKHYHAWKTVHTHTAWTHTEDLCDQSDFSPVILEEQSQIWAKSSGNRWVSLSVYSLLLSFCPNNRNNWYLWSEKHV